MEDNTAKMKFVAALAQAQLSFKPVEKISNNPFFKSKYAPYEEVWKSVGNPLNANGFIVIHQTPFNEQGMFFLTTRLMHVDGHEEKSIHLVQGDKVDNMQGRGSAETYAKRYNLVNLTAVPIVAEDDDGNAACEREEKDDTIPEVHAKEIQKLINGDKETAKEFFTEFKIAKITDLKRDYYRKAINWLKEEGSNDIAKAQ